jgi:hypothetical protein
MEISVQLLPALHVRRAGISVFPKEHQNLITEAHYILATISLKIRARITKFQGDVPEALKRGISLVRLVMCTDHVNLTAAERIILTTKISLTPTIKPKPILLFPQRPIRCGHKEESQPLHFNFKTRFLPAPIFIIHLAAIAHEMATHPITLSLPFFRRAGEERIPSVSIM